MLAQLVPAPLVRVFASPYVAGDSMVTALDVAADLLERQMLTTLDLLGEDVQDDLQVEANETVYRELLQAIDRDPRFRDRSKRPTVSVKPSAFTTGDMEAAFAPIRRLVEEAHRVRVGVTIDMEDHRWTDVTLEHAVALYKEGFDVGTVLQTRLHRTEADLARIPGGMRVRLVIGIYPEPADIATTDKRVMKDRMLAFADTLASCGVYVEFATHDEDYVRRYVQEVAPKAASLGTEVQMLLGVPRAGLQGELESGALGAVVPVRMYVPFAVGWDDATAYLRRRMAESPSMVFLVLRNLFQRKR